MKAKIKTQAKGRSKRITLYEVDLPREVTIEQNEYYIRIKPIGLDTRGKTNKVTEQSSRTKSITIVTDVADGVYNVEVLDTEVYINL